jgi:ABC-type transport system substrate-binding protein
MIKLFLGFICATALLMAVAQAQTSTSSTTTTTGAGSETSTTRTETYGTVTDFSPGASLVLSTGSGEAVQYRFSKTVTYVTPDGKVIDASRIKKNSKVRVHYIKEGNDMLVDKVIVTDTD